MKLGISILPTQPIDELVWFATQAEKAGIDAVWIADDTPFPPYGDVFMAATAIAMKTSKVTVGTAVTNPYMRHPAIIASSILALENLSKGRSILGISTGGPSQLVTIGLKPFNKPIRTVREAVAVFRKLFKGETVTFKGASFELHDVHLEKPRRNIPIYIAARSEGLLKLTGKVADGQLLNCPSDPTFLKHSIRKIKEGAKEAGRDLSKIDMVGIADFLVMKNGKEAKRMIRTQAARRIAFHPPTVAELLGVSEDLHLQLKELMRGGKPEKAAAMIPDEIVDKVALAGDPASCIEQAIRLGKSGLDQLIFSIRAKPEESFKLLLKEVVPRLKKPPK